jgi:hypothetical protein
MEGAKAPRELPIISAPASPQTRGPASTPTSRPTLTLDQQLHQATTSQTISPTSPPTTGPKPSLTSLPSSSPKPDNCIDNSASHSGDSPPTMEGERAPGEDPRLVSRRERTTDGRMNAGTTRKLIREPTCSQRADGRKQQRRSPKQWTKEPTTWPRSRGTNTSSKGAPEAPWNRGPNKGPGTDSGTKEAADGWTNHAAKV